MNRLTDYLKENNLTQTEFAALLGVTQSAVNAWVHGRRIPDARNIVKIRGLTKGFVRPEDWF